jgi:hypothetical protein
MDYFVDDERRTFIHKALRYLFGQFETELFEQSGGADGTRTRDPRRDRPVF